MTSYLAWRPVSWIPLWLVASRPAPWPESRVQLRPVPLRPVLLRPVPLWPVLPRPVLLRPVPLWPVLPRPVPLWPVPWPASRVLLRRVLSSPAPWVPL